MIAILTEKMGNGNKWIDLYETMEQASRELIEEYGLIDTEHLKVESESKVIIGFIINNRFLPVLEEEDPDEALFIRSFVPTDHCVIPHYPLPAGTYGAIVSEVTVSTPREITLKFKIVPQIDLTDLCDKCGSPEIYRKWNNAKLCRICFDDLDSDEHDDEEGSDD